MATEAFGTSQVQMATYNTIEARHLLPSAYQSPFEAFKRSYPQTNFENMFPMMQYQGSVRTVFDELETALLSPNDGFNFSAIALHPARLIRAMIDWKIDHVSDNMDRYVTKAIEIGLAIHQRRHEAITALRSLRESIFAERPEILDSDVIQRDDAPTWHGTDPQLSYATARQLAFQFEGQDVLFIALGHGGTAAGLDVYSRYIDISQNTNSAFYVVRFSRNKKQDEQPQLSEEELKRLQELARGRKIVVFEEDSVTHGTLQGAQAYFGEAFGKQVTARSNLELGSSVASNPATREPSLIQKIHLQKNLILKIISLRQRNNFKN